MALHSGWSNSVAALAERDRATKLGNGEYCKASKKAKRLYVHCRGSGHRLRPAEQNVNTGYCHRDSLIPPLQTSRITMLISIC
jgi:hypothetical protein